jgi:adenylate cyclase
MSPELRRQALQARILIADDVEANVLLLTTLLRQHGYSNVHSTMDAREVAKLHRASPFELILLDLQMPHLDGFAVIEQLKPLVVDDFLPVVIVTAISDQENRLKALRLGARDYITKPLAVDEVLQRIGNYLEVRLLYRERREEAENLERRVREQLAQLEKLSRLKRFFSPQLAERIVAGGIDDPLRTHRREITAVSIDLRGFTAFTESAEPEEVIRILHDYHAEIGRLILKHEGTIEFFAGDGIMVIFNDPVPVLDAEARAVRMALEMQTAFRPLAAAWRKQGFELGLGIGIAQGYATIGAIGFEGRWDYGAIGSVTNLAARLCNEAGSGQVLLQGKVLRRIGAQVESRPVGNLALKGFAQPVPAVQVLRWIAGTDMPVPA